MSHGATDTGSPLAPTEFRVVQDAPLQLAPLDHGLDLCRLGPGLRCREGLRRRPGGALRGRGVLATSDHRGPDLIELASAVGGRARSLHPECLLKRLRPGGGLPTGLLGSALRFAREALGSSETDVTTGLAEWWDARNASGSSLPASVSSTNNGTISAAGRVITL